MKTKFILHGGFDQKGKPGNDSFTQEILEGTPNDVKILLVYFAKEKDRIDVNKKEDIDQFEKHKGTKNLYFEVAEEEHFEDQILRSDIIYLHGGKTVKILEVLRKFPNLKELFKGKIIAADSAGTNSLSTFCYGSFGGDIMECLGIIPFKIICHYLDKYKDKADALSKYAPDSELLLLSEYEYKVFYQ